MRGMRPEKFFAISVKPELGELFEILGFSEEEAFEIFAQVLNIGMASSPSDTSQGASATLPAP